MWLLAARRRADIVRLVAYVVAEMVIEGVFGLTA